MQKDERTRDRESRYNPSAARTAPSSLVELANVHLPEWGAELLGTELMVFVGLSVVVIDFGSGSPVAPIVPDPSWRLLLTGMLFATTGSVFALTPPGAGAARTSIQR